MESLRGELKKFGIIEISKKGDTLELNIFTVGILADEKTHEELKNEIKKINKI